MKTIQNLKNDLQKINHKSYGMYKSLQDSYQYKNFILHIDHVQGDPYASPSRIRLEVTGDHHRFPKKYYSYRSDEKIDRENKKLRKITLEDQILRKFHKELRQIDKSAKGSGKSGRITTCRVGQKVLERIAVVISESRLEFRLEMGFPAKGRTILADEMAKLLFEIVPALADATLFYENWSDKEKKKLEQAIFLCDDQYVIRKELERKNLIAFIADGSILPRESGISDYPMKGAIPFYSDNDNKALQVTINVPHKGTITGMGIPKGITTIVGGGYHGKSTLLKALEQGVYNHILGDGREYVLSLDNAMKIRAEDGRSVNHTDISMFINNLPTKQDTRDFSSENASGSTSQAANLVEALESGSKLLFIDEDTSATNFMIRDKMMEALVSKEKEPITPLLRNICSICHDLDISFVIVVGSSGEYLGVSDHVLQMDHYKVSDVTKRAKAIFEKYTDSSMQNTEVVLPKNDSKRKMIPGRIPDRIKMKTIDTDSIIIDREVIDVRYLEQICDTGQTIALGYIIDWILKNVKKPMAMEAIVNLITKQIEEKGLISMTGWNYASGHPVCPRRQEIFACMNRFRSLKMEINI